MQDNINKIGPIRLSFKWSLVFLLFFATAVWFANYSLHFNGFTINDSHDYAQLAKNAYNGNGYSTSVLRPLVYRFFNTLPQPEVTRMPGYPYSLGLFFKIFGPTDFSIVLFNGIFYAALVLLVYLLAYELSNDIFTSMIAAAATALMQGFLMHSLQAEPNIMYAALFVAFFYYYLKYPQKTLIHGIMLGLLHLVRANTQFVFIAIFFLSIFRNPKDIKEGLFVAIKLAAGFLIGVTPHLIRNHIIIGNPFFSLYSYSLLLQTKSFPGYTIWNQINEISPLLFVKTHPYEIIFKSYQWFSRLIEESIEFYGMIWLLLIGITFFISTENPRVKSFKIITLAGIFVQTLLVLPFGAVPYYYMFFSPVMIIISTINVMEYFKSHSKIVLLCGLIVFAATTVSYWKNSKPVNPFISIGKQVEELTGGNDIILTDIPWELAWYANRNTIWLTYDMDTLRTISKTLKPKYILLSGGVNSPYTPYKDFLWTRMLNDPDYARSLGYEQINVITFQNLPVALMFKSMDLDKTSQKYPISNKEFLI